MNKLEELSKDQFLDLRKECKSDAEISRKLKCSRQYLNVIRKSLAIPSVKKKKLPRDEKIFKEKLLGRSIIRISKKYNLSVGHVYRIINKMEESWKERNS